MLVFDQRTSTWDTPLQPVGQGVVIRQKKAWRRREGVFVYFEDSMIQGGSMGRPREEKLVSRSHIFIIYTI